MGGAGCYGRGATCTTALTSPGLSRPPTGCLNFSRPSPLASGRPGRAGPAPQRGPRAHLGAPSCPPPPPPPPSTSPPSHPLAPLPAPSYRGCLFALPLTPPRRACHPSLPTPATPLPAPASLSFSPGVSTRGCGQRAMAAARTSWLRELRLHGALHEEGPSAAGPRAERRNVRPGGSPLPRGRHGGRADLVVAEAAASRCPP